MMVSAEEDLEGGVGDGVAFGGGGSGGVLKRGGAGGGESRGGAEAGRGGFLGGVVWWGCGGEVFRGVA